MDKIYLIFYLAIIVFLAFAALLIISIMPDNKKNVQSTSDKVLKRRNNTWQSWFAIISISLVIAIWTLLGALFFLIIVWLLRLNPEHDSSSTLSDQEKKFARGIYAWLLFSPILTIPVFIVLLYNLGYEASSTDSRVLASIIPLIFHLPLLSGLYSKSAFVYRHTQQGILLIALRVGMATLASSITFGSDDGFWLFIFGNGSLWLFGSIWGWHQIARGEYWWMKQNDEKTVSLETTRTVTYRMDQEFEDLLKSLNADDKVAAKAKAFLAFRGGKPETRKRATEVLSKLGEVESF